MCDLADVAECVHDMVKQVSESVGTAQPETDSEPAPVIVKATEESEVTSSIPRAECTIDGEEEDEVEGDGGGEEVEEAVDPKLLSLCELYLNAVVEFQVTMINRVEAQHALTPTRSFVLAKPDTFKGKLLKFRFCPAARFLAGAVLVFVDPMKHYHATSMIKPLTCLCGEALQANGKMEGYRFVKGIGGTFYVLKLARYVCRHECKFAKEKEQKTLSFNALSPAIQNQLPLNLRETAFVSTERTSVMAWDARVSQTLAELGCPFGRLERAVKSADATRAVEEDMKRMEQYELSGMDHKLAPKALKGHQVLAFRGLFVVKARSLRRIYILQIGTQEELIQTLLYLNGAGATVLSQDHCFPWGNKAGVNGATAVFVIANGFGQPVVVRGCATKSILEASELVKFAYDSTAGLVRYWFTDYGKNDESTIREVSKDVKILEDIFHIIQKLNDCVAKTSPFRQEWERVVTAAFFTFDEDCVREFLRKHANDPAVAELCKDPSYLKKQRSIKKSVKQPGEIIDCLDKCLGYFIRNKCFGSGGDGSIIIDVHQSLDRALRYCDYPNDFEWYVQVETANSVLYFTLRGTNSVENFNRLISQSQLHMYGGRLAHLLLIRLGAVRSLDIARRIRMVPLVEGVSDLTLINAYVRKSQKCVEQEWIEEGQVYFHQSCYVEPVSEDLFQSGLNSVSGSAVEKAKRLLAGDPVFSGSTRVKPLSELALTLEQIATAAGLPRYDPFDRDRKSELRLLFALIRSGLFWRVKRDAAKYINEEGVFKEAFFIAIAHATADEILHLSLLAIQWNCVIVEYHASRRSDSRMFNCDVVVHEIRFKERASFSDILKVYSCGVVKRNHPQYIQDAAAAVFAPGPAAFETPLPRLFLLEEVPVEPLLAKTSSSSVPRRPFVRPQHKSSSSSSALADLSVSSSALTALSTSLLDGPPADGEVSAASPAEAMAVQAEASEVKTKRTRYDCPECQRRKHTKDSTCEFYVFYTSHGSFCREGENDSRFASAIRKWGEMKASKV